MFAMGLMYGESFDLHPDLGVWLTSLMQCPISLRWYYLGGFRRRIHGAEYGVESFG